MIKNILPVHMVAVLLFLSACHPSQEHNGLYFSNSMEDSYAWTDHPQSNIIWSEVARSGNYVCRLDSTMPYSVTYYMKVSDISTRPLKSVRLSVWVYMSTLMADPFLGVDIQDGSHRTTEWVAVPARKSIGEPQRWQQISLRVDLTEKNRNNKDNYYRIYVTNTSPDYVLADDLEIQFAE